MRHLFGLEPADLAVEKDGEEMILRPAAVGQVYDSYTGGTQITDLLEVDGATPATQVTADDNARVGFYADEVAGVGRKLVYVDFGFAAGRFAMTATSIGAEVDLKANALDAVLRSGDQTATGLKTFRRLFVDLADLINPGLVLRQNNTVTTTSDTEMMQALYKALKGWWLNEKAQMRGRRVDSEVVFKLFGRGNDGTANTQVDIMQILADVGGVDTTVARVGALGSFYHKLNDLTQWTDLTVDSPTTATKYTAQANGTANFNAPQIKVINGGTEVIGRGRINVAAITGVADEVIASALPTAIALRGMGTNVSSVPTRERPATCFITGSGAQRLMVTSTGQLKAVGTVTGGSGVYMDLGPMRYNLES